MSTVLRVNQGGSGLSTIPTGSVIVAQSTNTLSALASTSGTSYLKNINGVLSWGTIDLSGYELLSNKATTFGTINDTLYPSVKAVNDAIVAAVTGLLDYRGQYNASTNLFPATGGSGIAGAVLKGDFWIISVGGTLGGIVVHIGDYVIALVDTPAQTSSNWDTIDTGTGYVPENVANKVTSISGSSTNVQYPSAKLLYDQLAGKQASGSYQPLNTNLTSIGGLANASGFLKNDGSGSFSYSAAGAGDMILSGIQSVTGLKTFDTTKLAVKGSSTGITSIASANVGATSYIATLPAKDITIAGTIDIPSVGNWGALNYPTWASGTPFVKMTAAGIFGLDTNTYLTAVTAHNLLSATHGDTLANTVVRGDILIGNATPKWARLAFPATPTGKIIQATATDVGWSDNPLTIGTSASVSGSNTGDTAANSTANTYADGKVEDSITDGHTTVAPSGNAVFDALALKAPINTPFFWTAVAMTRTANTTIVTNADVNMSAILGRGMVIKWTDTTDHCGMIVSVAYSSPHTTITIVGDVCAATASAFKYAPMDAKVINFAYAGTVGAVAADCMNAYYADQPYRLLGADLTAGTAGTTNNTTIDINVGTTLFTTKPTLATTSAIGIGFTADNNKSLSLSDKITIDIDAVQGTPCTDLYVKLFIFPTKFLSLT